MRLLIHYVGDIHQPLHTSTRVNPEFTAGDRGGNSVHLPYHYGKKNLHSVWDSVVYHFRANDKLPYNASAWRKVGHYAKKLVDTYEIPDSEKYDLNCENWAAESFTVVEDFIYRGVVADEHLSDEYNDEGMELAERQMVKGGYRLANLLLSLDLEDYSPNSV